MLGALTVPAASAQTTSTRKLTIDDLYRLRDVSGPQISPDGGWVAYTVAAPDAVKDRSDKDVWMSSWDGRRSLRLTTSKSGEHTPRWSPDGRYWRSFRTGTTPVRLQQVWLLDRAGGEAERVTDLPGGVSQYAWSPDRKRLALIASDPDPDSATVTPDTTQRTPPAHCHRPISVQGR